MSNDADNDFNDEDYAGGRAETDSGGSKMTYQSQQIQPLQVLALNENTVRGSIVWNLPESIQFTPGETISITVTITNPTEERRIYALPWALIQSGTVVAVGMVTADDTNDWWIDGGETEEISFELSPEFTDCYLNLSLVGGLTDVEEEAEEVEEIIDSLTTYLYSTAVQPYQVQALWLQQAVTVLMVIGVICFGLVEVIKSATGVVKK